tara:strand:- start:54 stop:590 length:537 start_codon:yes stop_codon:yes gene_type:complete
MPYWLNETVQHPAVCTIRVHWQCKHLNGADVYRIPMPRNKRKWADKGVHLFSNDFKSWFNSPEGCQWRHNVMLYIILKEGGAEHMITEIKWLVGRESDEIGGDDEWIYEVHPSYVAKPITMLLDPDDAGEFPFLYHLTHQHPMRWRLPDPGESDFGEMGMDGQLFSPVRQQRADCQQV